MNELQQSVDTRDRKTGFVPQRIVVIGTTGCGKSTLAGEIARRMDAPHIELDALHWDADWTAAETPVFRERVSVALSGDRWTVDGNYSQVRDLVWERAEVVLWLDYPLPLNYARLLRRTLRRMSTKETLWNGNREEWRFLFFSQESLFIWLLQTHERYRREFPKLFSQPEHRHLRVEHFTHPHLAQRWLDDFRPR